ncbi:unnamed protein product [Trichogramma brassicae]|uniref:Elongation factor G-like domain-containing protein n=1 Tax=Trichogramma brassicae TaxID=86971 RepID=A0A6H5IZW2_9HYME|nr:unnamed protein product [Trichogramma brassicae]
MLLLSHYTCPFSKKENFSSRKKTISGLAHAKVRAMFDHSGTVVTEAGLSDAVQIIGWRELPNAGEEILEVENEKRANQVMKFRNAKINEQKSVEHKVAAEEKHKIHRVSNEQSILQSTRRFFICYKFLMISFSVMKL